MSFHVLARTHHFGKLRAPTPCLVPESIPIVDLKASLYSRAHGQVHKPNNIARSPIYLNPSPKAFQTRSIPHTGPKTCLEAPLKEHSRTTLKGTRPTADFLTEPFEKKTPRLRVVGGGQTPRSDVLHHLAAARLSIYLSIYLSMYACMHACMYACMYACKCVYIYIHAHMHLCMCVFTGEDIEYTYIHIQVWTDRYR